MHAPGWDYLEFTTNWREAVTFLLMKVSPKLRRKRKKPWILIQILRKLTHVLERSRETTTMTGMVRIQLSNVHFNWSQQIRRPSDCPLAWRRHWAASMKQ